MERLNEHQIRKARSVIKGLSNLERLKIISLLQQGEMTAATITDNLNVGKRETQRHLNILIAIKVVNKERKKINLRTYRYTLNSKTYHLYISCITRMTA